MNADILTAELIISALEWEAAKRERGGRVYKYATLLVCKECLMTHVLDYAGVSLWRNERGYKCELCGASEFWLYDLFLPITTIRRLDDVLLENRRKLGLGGGV